MRNGKIGLVALVLGCSLQAQTSLVLQPGSILGNDASLGSHTNFNTENTNYGNNIYNSAYCIPGAQGGQNSNRAVMSFDLTSIPAGSTIISASLTLYATGYINASLPGHFGNNISTISLITGAWNENTVTWNTAPAITTNNQATLPQSTSATQDYTTTVTAMVQDMVNNPSTSFGFYLRMVTENPSSAAGLLFHSSDGPDSTKWPKLEIVFIPGDCIQPDPNSGNDASLGFHTNYNTENTNYGANIYFSAYCIPGAAGGDNTNRAIISFDLSAIPSSATIQTADLYLFATGYINALLPGHFGSNAAAIERVTSPWNENTVTWNSAPATTTTGSAALAQSTTATQDYVVNVSAITQYQVTNSTQNYGMLFRQNVENSSAQSGLLFYSSDHSVPGLRPKLCITYIDSAGPKSIEVFAQPDVFVNVFPNPSADFVQLTTDEVMNDAVINFYDAEGRLVKSRTESGPADQFKISVADLADGAYVVEIVAENKSGSARFVKTR